MGQKQVTMPDYSVKVLEKIREEEPISPSKLEKRMDIPSEDFKYVVRRLREKGLIASRPDLLDMRCVYYYLNITDEEMKLIREKGVSFFVTHHI